MVGHRILATDPELILEIDGPAVPTTLAGRYVEVSSLTFNGLTLTEYRRRDVTCPATA